MNKHGSNVHPHFDVAAPSSFDRSTAEDALGSPKDLCHCDREVKHEVKQAVRLVIQLGDM